MYAPPKISPKMSRANIFLIITQYALEFQAVFIVKRNPVEGQNSSSIPENKPPKVTQLLPGLVLGILRYTYNVCGDVTNCCRSASERVSMGWWLFKGLNSGFVPANG